MSRLSNNLKCRGLNKASWRHCGGLTTVSYQDQTVNFNKFLTHFLERFRFNQLFLLLHYLIKYLIEQDADFHVFVANQAHGKLFNKAKLNNAAFDYVNNNYQADCIIFRVSTKSAMWSFIIMIYWLWIFILTNASWSMIHRLWCISQNAEKSTQF